MRNRLLYVAAMWSAVWFSAGLAPAAAPRIGQTHDPAWGGHGMVVAGEGFVAGKTEFRIWSPQWDRMDKERAEGKRSGAARSKEAERDALRLLLMSCLGRAVGPLPASPPPNSMACPVLKCTDRLAVIEFPRYTRYHSGPARRYLAVLYAGDKSVGWSAPWVFNRTAAHFLTADEAAPGGSVRVIGRNLWTGGPPPLVALLDREGDRRIACAVRSRYYIHNNYSAYYDWEFSVPKDVRPGRYEVWAHDGTGDAYGWSGPLALTVRAPSAERRKLIDAAARGVVCNGVADDAPALQKALDEAGRQAPAIVLLPAGICRVSKTLTIPPGVTVRGRGMRTSILRSVADAPRLYTMLRGGGEFAMEDLCVEGSGPHVRLLVSVGARRGLAANVRLERCRFTTTEPGRLREVAIDRVRRMRIAGCEFKDTGAYATYTELSYIGHNRSEVAHWLYGGLALGLGRVSRNCLIEHNHSIGPRGSGGVATGCHYHTCFARNIAERTLTCDGEAYLLEGAGAVWYGKCVCPADDRVMFPRGNWTVRAKGKDLPAWLDKYLKPYLGQYVVAITKGRGVGQYRKVAALEGETMRLESPWGVRPDATSEAILMHGSIECTLVNNMGFDTNGTTGGLFGAGGMNTIIHGHVGARTGGAYVWSFVDPPDPLRTDGVKHRVVPDYFNQILACRWLGKGNVFLTDGVHGRFSAEQLDAIPQLGTLIAQNEVRYPADYGWNASSFIDRAADPAKDRDNPDRGKFPAVVVAGRNVHAIVEENRIRRADVGVWLGSQASGAIVRRNRFTAIGYETVKDLGAGSLIGPTTAKTDWHSYWGAGMNIELLPERLRNGPPKRD